MREEPMKYIVANELSKIKNQLSNGDNKTQERLLLIVRQQVLEDLLDKYDSLLDESKKVSERIHKKMSRKEEK